LPISWWQLPWCVCSCRDISTSRLTSNYLQARGLVFPWIVTEVPADKPIHWFHRVFPMNLLALYLVATAPLIALYVATVAARTTRRGKEASDGS
jgi:hypothetical protein